MAGFPVATAEEFAPPEKKRKPCFACGKPIVVGRWDGWNGFLVECPYCQRLHGRPWRFVPLIYLSLLLNVLSFFLTMRPVPAATLGFVMGTLFYWTGEWLATTLVPQVADIVFALVYVLSPVVVNALLFVRHQKKLGTPART